MINSCTLSAEQALAAGSVAMMQILRKLHNGGVGNDHGKRSGRSLRIRIGDGVMGVMAELACAQMLNLAWFPGGRDITRNQEVGGFIEARGTEHTNGHLVIYQDDSERGIYALIINQYPHFTLAGFLVGQDGKDLQYWKEDCNNPSFWIPQDKLSSLDAALARLKALWPGLPDTPLRLLSNSRRVL
jgi:hypothetical protein